MKLKEWHRTVLLLIILSLMIGLFIWMNNNYTDNFIESF